MLLAQAGYLSYPDLIDTLIAFENETNEQVWNIMASLLISLRKFVINNKKAELQLKKLSYKLASQEFARLGFTPINNEEENDTKLRSIILSLTLYSENKKAIDFTIATAKNEDVNNIDAEIRALVLSGAIKNSTDNRLFTQLINLYPNTNDPNLRSDIMSAITSTKNVDNINLLLKKITNKEFARPQDIAHWFILLLRNKYATELTWLWLRDNWQWIEETFKGDKSYDDYARLSVLGLHTPAHLMEYKDFFQPLKKEAALRRVIELGETDLTAKVKLIEDNKQIIAKKLNEFAL